MATSIAFGLMFSTVLVLLAVPALLAIYERHLSPTQTNLAKKTQHEKFIKNRMA
jgi:hypothetical protein